MVILLSRRFHWRLRAHRSRVNCFLGCSGKPAVTKTAMDKAFTQFEDGLRAFMRGDRAHDFVSLALDLFRLQFRNNLPYRRFCEAERVTPDSVRAWHEI